MKNLLAVALLSISLYGCGSGDSLAPAESFSEPVSQSLEAAPTQVQLDTPVNVVYATTPSSIVMFQLHYYYKVKHRFIGSRDSIEDPAIVTVFEARLLFNHNTGGVRYTILKNGVEYADVFAEEADENSQFNYIIRAEKEGAFSENQDFIDEQLQNNWGLLVRGSTGQVHTHVVEPMQVIQEPFEL